MPTDSPREQIHLEKGGFAHHIIILHVQQNAFLINPSQEKS